MEEVERLLAQGDSLIETDLDRAEDYYAEVFKIADRQKDFEGYQAQFQCVLKLADVYQRRAKEHIEEYTKVAALLNYALNLCASRKVLEGLTEEQRQPFQERILLIQKRLAEIEEIFLQQLSEKIKRSLTNPYPYLNWNGTHRSALKSIRDEIRDILTTIDESFKTEKLFTKEERDRIPEDLALEALWTEAIETLYYHITDRMKGFIRKLLKECRETLGEAPCRYAVIGLGSLSRSEMTPYSDLEFAILIDESKTPEARKTAETYFRYLVMLLHFKIINLGETILPAMAIRSLNDYEGEAITNWFYDEITQKGFAFDGAMPWASKTPLGRQPTKEKPNPPKLIASPSEMASYQREDHVLKEGYHLANILVNAVYIDGEEGSFELVGQYEQAIKRELERTPNQLTSSLANGAEAMDGNRVRASAASPHLVIPIIPTVGQVRAKKLLSEDIDRFDPKVDDPDTSGKLHEIKHDLYRLPNTMIEGLALYFGYYGELERREIDPRETSKSFWSRVERLRAENKISEEGAFHLRQAFSLIVYIRLKAYLVEHAQYERMGVSAREKPNTSASLDQLSEITVRRIFHLEGSLGLLYQIYRTLLPFHETLQQFVLSEGQLILLRDQPFFGQDRLTTARIHLRFQQYTQVIELLKEDEERFYNLKLRTLTKPEQKNLLAISYLLCRAYYGLEKFTREISTLEFQRDIEEELHDREHIAITLTNLACAYGGLGNTENKKKFLEQALSIYEELYGTDHMDEHLEVAMTLGNLGVVYGELGDIKNQEKNLTRTLHIYERNHDDVGVARTLVNLSNVFRTLGDVGQKKALLDRALRLLRNYYEHDNVEIAKILENLANLFQELNENKHAEDMFKYVLKIKRNFYGENHVSVAKTLGNLAIVYNKMGKTKKAKKLLKNALKIQEDFYGRDCKEEVETLVNLSSVYIILEKPWKCIELSRRAVEIYQSCYGQDHIKMVKPLESLGNAYIASSDALNAIKTLGHALTIKRNFYSHNHPEIAKTLYSLAVGYMQQSDLSKASLYVQQAYTILLSVYPQAGESYPLTQQAKRLLEHIQALSLTQGDAIRAVQNPQVTAEIGGSIVGFWHARCSSETHAAAPFVGDRRQNREVADADLRQHITHAHNGRETPSGRVSPAP